MGKLRRISEKMALCNLTMEKSPKSILLGIEILDIFIDFLRKIRQSWISGKKEIVSTDIHMSTETTISYLQKSFSISAF